MATPRTSPSTRKAQPLDAERERRSPMPATIVLLVAFVLLAVTGVVTVVMPEISDAGEDEDGDAETEQRSAPAASQGSPDPSSGS